MELIYLISRTLIPLHVFMLWAAASYSGCARGGRALPRPQLPCDLVANSFCDSSGEEYPWHQMRKWVFENQGLIKRMYGNTKHYSVLREELDNGHNGQPYEMYSPEFQGNHNIDHNPQDNNKVRNSVRSHAFARADEEDFVNRNNLLDNVPQSQPRENRIDEETRMRKREARFGARSLSVDESANVGRNKIRTADRFLNKDLRQKLNHEKKVGVSITKSYSSPTAAGNKTVNGTTTVAGDDYPEPTTAAYSDLAESQEAEAVDSPPEVSPDVMKSVADSLVDVQEEEVSAVTETSDAETTTIDQDWTIIDDITSTTESLLTTTETPIGESTTDYEGLSTLESLVTDATTEDSAVSAITAEDLSVESRTSVGFEIELEAELSDSGMTFKFPEEETKTFPEVYPSETVPREEEFETIRDILDEMKNADEQVNVETENIDVSTSTTTEKIVDESDAMARNPTRSTPVLIRKKHFKRRTNEGKINASDKNSELGITSRKPPGRGQAFYRRPSQMATPAPLEEAPSPSTIPPPPLHPDPPRGVNACPVTEDVVAPYWANNTRGVVLALLNIKPFEQYVHWEKCRYQYRQMNCRHNCRCEQQYRLHRMLAFDPQDDCKGVFSDWFRFPSGCVCKCYDLPATAQVRYVTDYSRRPRTDPLDSVRVSPQGRSSPPENVREEMFSNNDRDERFSKTDDLSEVYFMDEEELEIPDVSDEVQNMDLEAQGSSDSIQISVGKDSHVYKIKEEINVHNMPDFAPNTVQRKKYRHYQSNGEDSSAKAFASNRNDNNNYEKSPAVATREILPNNLMTTQPQRYNLRFVNPQRLLPPSSPSLLSHIKRIHFMNSGYRPNMNRRVYRPNKHRMRSMKSLSNWNPQGSFPPSLSNPKFKKYSNRMPKTYTVTNSMRDEGPDGSNNLNFQNLIRHPDMNGVSQEQKNEVYDSFSGDNDQYFFNLTSHLLRARQLELQ